MRKHTWEYGINGAIVAVGAECYSCEVIETENDGALYGLAATKEQAIEGVAHAIAVQVKKRGASKVVVSPMRAGLHAGREHFYVRVTFN